MSYYDGLDEAQSIVTQTQAAEASEAIQAQSASTQFGGLAGAVVGGIPVSVGGVYQDGTIAGDNTYIVVNLAGVALTVSLSIGAVVAAVQAALGLQTLATVKCHTAAVAPTVADDSGAGFARFSMWIDTVLDDIYICTNPALGAAVWRKVN